MERRSQAHTTAALGYSREELLAGVAEIVAALWEAVEQNARVSMIRVGNVAINLPQVADIQRYEDGRVAVFFSGFGGEELVFSGDEAAQLWELVQCIAPDVAEACAEMRAEADESQEWDDDDE